MAQRQSCAQLVTEITAPLVIDNSDSSNSEESDVESNSYTAPPLPQLPPPLARPQVGMKTPKSSFPPTKCINVHCKEEKRDLRSQIASLKQEIEDCKYMSIHMNIVLQILCT